MEPSAIYCLEKSREKKWKIQEFSSVEFLGILIIAAAATIPHRVIRLYIHQVFLVEETFDSMSVNVNL